MRRGGLDPPAAALEAGQLREPPCAPDGKENNHAKENGLAENQKVRGAEKLHAGKSGDAGTAGKSLHRQGGRVSGFLGAAAGTAGRRCRAGTDCN
nr:MAG TPA: hypothetical protein [Caudoviricetes sp.]